MEFVQKVEREIRRTGLLKAGQRVAAGCSGGADSVALLRLLDELKDRLGIQLLACHLNHQLRGEEADGDEAFVKELAEELDLEFVSRRVDVAALVEAKKLNLEEAGRGARLEFFASLVQEGKADVVAVAHTLDDQAETVLARLVRGSGIKGLAGIYPMVEKRGQSSKLTLVRPLLHVRRGELRKYLKGHKQEWREDRSNQDRQRERNRIRMDWLPELNPAAIEHLGQLAAHAREEESFWRGYIEELFGAQVRQEKGEWLLSVADLENYPPWVKGESEREQAEASRAVARRLLRRMLAEVRGDLRRISAGHIESVLELATEGQSGQELHLPGVRVERRFDQMVFRSSAGGQETEPAEGSYYEVEVAGPGLVGLPGGQGLEVKLMDVEISQTGYNEMAGKALDAERVGFPLLVRTWRPGDRYRPHDARRAVKLKELFQRRRIPRHERRLCPVVLSGGEIVWTAPFGPAEESSLRPGSRKAIWIKETPVT